MSSKVRGFALIELAIALALLSIITSVGLTQYQEYLRTRLARAQGEQIKAVNDVVSSYTTNYFNEIVTGAAITGVADPLAPTVAELAALMNVSMSSTNLYGGGFGIQLELAPAACTPPACAIQGIVHLTAPMTAGGAVDYSLLGEAVLAAGANAGYSMPDAPSSISGYGGAWTRTNPVGATAGILAIRNGFDSLALDKFLRRDGTRPMTGSLNMAGNSIRDVSGLELSTAVSEDDACPTNGALARNAEGAVMSCENSLWKRQRSMWGDPVASFASLPTCDATTNVGYTRIVLVPTLGSGPRAYTCNGAAWQAVFLDDAGNVTIPGNLVVDQTASLNNLSGRLQLDATTIVTEGDFCPGGSSDNGRLARDSNGTIYSCQSARWAPAFAIPGSDLNFYMDWYMGGDTYSTSAQRRVIGGRTDGSGGLLLNAFADSCCSYSSSAAQTNVCGRSAVQSTYGCWFYASPGGAYAGYGAMGRAQLVGDTLHIWTCGLSLCGIPGIAATTPNGTFVGSVVGIK